MCTHLHKRNGGTYYFRRAIPVCLRPSFDGRHEWVISLGTKDRAHAKRLIPRYTIASDEALQRALEGQPISVAALVPTSKEKSSGGALMPSLCPVEVPDTPFALSGRPTEASCSLPLPLLNTFEAYALEQRIKPGTASEWRSMLKALVKFVGHDDARRLTVDDIDRWRDALLSEPTRRGTLRDPVTVKDKYLSCLRATLGWAVEKRKLDDNIAAKVKVRVPRKAKLRSRDFTKAEASLILSASMNSMRLGLSCETIMARRWIPWLCAYSGARVNEISQLRGSDIAMIEGVWTIRITPEAGTVKANVARIVPLHPHIVEQGFPKIAKESGDDPIFYDPRKIKIAGAGNRYYKKVGERLRDWVRNDVGVKDANIQPNHGWRHTFKTLMVDANVPERVADALQGHAPRTVGQTYGSVTLQSLVKAVNAIPRFVIE